MRTIRTDELANKKPRKRLVAGGRINEPHRGNGENRDADDARCTALLLLIGLRSVLGAIVRCRLCVHLRAAFRFLDLRSCRLHGEDCKQQGRTKDGADYEMQNRSHAINLSLATRGFNPGLCAWGRLFRPNTRAKVPMNSAAYFFTPLLDFSPDFVADCPHLFEALRLGPGHP